MNNNNYPNPWIGIVFPASAVVLVALFVLAVYLFAGARSSRHTGAVLADSGRARVHDSTQAQRWADSAALVEYVREVERMRGDSLARLLAARATVWRTRTLPGRVDTLIARDTVRDSVLVPGADIRACLLADSALVVRVDSLAGELVQTRYDADQCAEEMRKRPTSCNRWSAFGLGAAAGLTAGLAVCVVVR